MRASTLYIMHWSVSFCLSFILGVIVAIVPARSMAVSPAIDVVIAGFEDEDFGAWTTTGVAFGSGPTASVKGLSGVVGRGAASSDRLTESGKGAEGSLYSPDFEVTHDYLNFSVAGGDHAFRAAVSLWVDGQVVRTSTGGNRRTLEWATWDLREFRGKTASIGVHDYCIEDELAFVVVDELTLSSRPKTAPGGDVVEAQKKVRRDAVAAIKRNAPRAAADPYRPIYHYTPPAQRMNDPNGPAWFDGYHHVFYQHMVFVGHGPATNVHWGHARSRDLVNWETLPLAIHPAYELGELSCFSGNLAWDKAGEPVQFVTMVPYKKDTMRQIWPARPVDREWFRWERTAEKPPHGLVPHGSPDRNLKDVFPFSVGNRRFLVLTDENIPFYEAVDDRLTQWAYRGTLDPESAECPNFFEVDGRWIYLSSPHQPVRYQVGDFDPTTAKFTPKTEGRVNHDSGFYASAAYRDNQGRTILHGITRGQKEGRGWTGALALPRVLSIGADDRPRMHPLPELSSLRREPFKLDGPRILRNRQEVIAGLQGDALEIIARFRVKDATAFGLHVRRSGDGSRFLPVQWSEGEITVARATPKYPCRYEIDPETREVTFRVFLDKGILDACTGDGQIFESRMHYAPLEDLAVAVFAEGGEATLVSLEAWAMAAATIDHSRLLETP